MTVQDNNEYITYDDEIQVLINKIPHLGGEVIDNENDYYLIRCTDYEVFKNIIDDLDNSDVVDCYEFDIYVANDSTLDDISSTVDDTDDLSKYKGQIRNIDIMLFFKPEYIEYDEYMDIEQDSITEKFGKVNTKKPFWFTLGIESNVDGGTFIITPHQTKLNTFLVYAQYQYDISIPCDEFYHVNKEQITNDVNSINAGLIFNKLVGGGFDLNSKATLNSDSEYLLTNNEFGILETLPAEFTTREDSFNIKDILSTFKNTTIFAESAIINEIKRVVKINFKGKKRIKLKCQKGYKFDVTRKVCVKIGGSELATMRKSKIKMVRTKKALGSGHKRMTQRRTKKAMRFRKLMGVKSK